MPLECRSLDFSFGENRVFSRFDFGMGESGITALLGPSGCGKTTLLHLIAGLLVPEKGELVDLPKTAYLFQEPRLMPWRNLSRNVSIPIENLFGKAGAADRADRFLGAVGLGGLERSFPDGLSGGQRQRAALARAFAYPAPLILMDEPFQSLDLPLRIQLMDLLKALLEAEPRAVLMVTHDPREAIYLADRVVVLGGSPAAVVLDEPIALSSADRNYSSAASAALEARLFAALTSR